MSSALALAMVAQHFDHRAVIKNRFEKRKVLDAIRQHYYGQQASRFEYFLILLGYFLSLTLQQYKGDLPDELLIGYTQTMVSDLVYTI